MKKTIIAITLFSFTLLSLHVHIHEDDHTDHASDYNTVEENCDFCQFNSENSFAETSTISAKMNFKNIVYELYVSNYICLIYFVS